MNKNMNSNEEALSLFNRLLEQLHQAGIIKIDNLVFVAPSAQYVNHIDTQIFGERQQEKEKTHPGPPYVGRENSARELPEALATEKAMVLWKKVQAAGYVDENYQPKLSRTQAALLADAMAEQLGIRKKWKVFETLWNRKNMYRDYYKALNLQQSLIFQDKIKQLFF